MEQSKGVRFDVKVLSGFLPSLTSKVLLDFIDFVSVIACIWTMFWLIYFTFVKDSIEILVHAISIYVNRIKWLYRILVIDNFLQYILDDSRETSVLSCSSKTDDNCLSKEVSRNSSGMNTSANNSTTEQFLMSSSGTPCSVKNKLMINPRVISFTDELSTAEANLKSMNSRPEDNTALSSEKITILSPGENIILNPNLNIVLNPEDDCAPDDVFTSPEQELDLKQKIFDWSLNKIRGSFRNDSSKKLSSACCVKEKFENLAAKVAQVQPSDVGDRERLNESNNDSPVNVGCCSSFFFYFRSKVQTKKIVPCSMHYKRF